MIVPQIQILQFDHRLCLWDTAAIRSPHVRFKFFSAIDPMIKYTNTWLAITDSEPGILMLSGHGLRQWLVTKKNFVRFDILLSQLRPLTNKTVHFSSCDTFDSEDESLKKIYSQSGAHIISGYTNTVNSKDSAGLESFLIDELEHPIISPQSITLAYRALYRAKRKIIERSGFCYVSSD